jgi:cobalt/nickel transport system permease protein
VVAVVHIPDGFLSTPVWAGLDVAAVPAVAVIARRAQHGFAESRAPLLGVMGAFVFAAQMINFPVGVGTSGHLVGGALLACTIGPAAAAVTMTAILALQALVFQDGGVLALGANVFNMAVVGVLAGYLPFHFLGTTRLRNLSLFAGGMLSVLSSALLALAELAISGVRMPGEILGLSLLLFAAAAALEGAITLTVIQAIEKLDPRFVTRPAGQSIYAVAALAVTAVVLATVGVLFASASPDGLEKFAEQVGIADRARAWLPAPLPDYEAPLPGGEWVRKAAAGLAGLVLIFAACAVVSRIASRRRSA